MRASVVWSTIQSASVEEFMAAMRVAYSRAPGNVPWRQPIPEDRAMCRNIKTLFNFEPPASELEIRDAALQFVRKLSGFTVPSKANEAAFEQAVAQVADAARGLIGSLVTHAEPRDREIEAERARARSR